ncbi:MAG: hypothetical protein M3174_08435 [Actinomycetota bacterium]|nr:hypothetical protein [Actinomycetota bacterium]
MRSREEFEAVLGLVRFGLNDCQVSRLTGVPRGTVRYMRVHGRSGPEDAGRTSDDCPICGRAHLAEERYAYLLGLYLGDGCLAQHERGVFRLRVTLDDRYPNIIDECAEAIRAVRSRSGVKAGRSRHSGCTVVYSYWKHWPCLFPQHGPGRKHERQIRLTPWQDEIVRRHIGSLLRGLIHSDGSRDLNWVKGKSYPRYQFSNVSYDIQKIFTTACERLGIHWTRPYWKTISVARRQDVARLDKIIGPKT